MSRVMLILSLAAMLVASAIPAAGQAQQGAGGGGPGPRLEIAQTECEAEGGRIVSGGLTGRLCELPNETIPVPCPSPGEEVSKEVSRLCRGFEIPENIINQGLADRSTTGSVTTIGTVTSKGDNSNQCVAPLQFGNTGPQQDTQGVIQYKSNSGDISETGSTFQFAPVLSAPCTQQVEQSSAASSGG